MSTSAVNFLIPPEVSGALRYERVAQLEAVLTLREKNQRIRFRRLLTAGAILLSFSVIAGVVLLRLASA